MDFAQIVKGTTFTILANALRSVLLKQFSTVTLVSIAHKIKSGMELTVSTDAILVEFFSMETVFVLTILNGTPSVVFLALVERSGIHCPEPVHVPLVPFGTEFHASLVKVEESTILLPEIVFVHLDQTGTVLHALQLAHLHSSGTQQPNNANANSTSSGMEQLALLALVEDSTILFLANVNAQLALGTVSHVYQVQSAKEE